MFCLCPVPAKVAGEGRGELDSRVSVDGLEKVTPNQNMAIFGIYVKFPGGMHKDIQGMMI